MARCWHGARHLVVQMAQSGFCSYILRPQVGIVPRGSRDSTIMELGPKHHAMYGVSALMLLWHCIWSLWGLCNWSPRGLVGPSDADHQKIAHIWAADHFFRDTDVDGQVRTWTPEVCKIMAQSH